MINWNIISHSVIIVYGTMLLLATAQYPDRVLYPPAHWRLILLIHDFSLVIGVKLHSEYLGFSLLVANFSRNIPFFLYWRPGCRHIPYVH